MADAKTILDSTRGPLGFSGPVGLKDVRIVADLSIKDMVNFITGANKQDAHLMNVNPARDFETKDFTDLRMISKDDACPACGKGIEIKNAMEIGHTFKLGTKYSSSLDAKYVDRDGEEKPTIMGCYGIGVNRIPAALIETSNDKDGIVWSAALSPYDMMLLPLNMREEKVSGMADKIYKTLSKKYDILYDDRDERAGVKFKDADLIGVPIQIVIGEKNAKNGLVEIKMRKDKHVETVKSEEVIKWFTHSKNS